jgi:hypothetical protein
VTSSQIHRRGRIAPTSPRGPTGEQALNAAGRAGYVARGVVYILIGILALRIAFGRAGGQADRQGALHEVAAQPFGAVMLWVLAVGFGCMAVWCASQAGLVKGPHRKVGARLVDGAKALLYASICWATAAYAVGSGGASSGNAQSQDWTASAMKHSGGRVLVGVVACVLIGMGSMLAVQAVRRRFLRQLDTGAMSRRTREVVTAVGVAGGVARGVVFAAVGVFALVAAVRFDPHQAKGMDATLRSFAHTPAGPWLLVAISVGLVLFGGSSFASARWGRL